jgi:hypothetical protein
MNRTYPSSAGISGHHDDWADGTVLGEETSCLATKKS